MGHRNFSTRGVVQWWMKMPSINLIIFYYCGHVIFEKEVAAMQDRRNKMLISVPCVRLRFGNESPAFAAQWFPESAVGRTLYEQAPGIGSWYEKNQVKYHISQF